MSIYPKGRKISDKTPVSNLEDQEQKKIEENIIKRKEIVNIIERITKKIV